MNNINTLRTKNKSCVNEKTQLLFFIIQNLSNFNIVLKHSYLLIQS